MLESELIGWLLLVSQLAFIMILPLLSEEMPDYEPKDGFEGSRL
jgi:hypothetical protein